eukprot:jgi/Bigna1/84487/fgenesh1_pg.142_\
MTLPAVGFHSREDSDLGFSPKSDGSSRCCSPITFITAGLDYSYDEEEHESSSCCSPSRKLKQVIEMAETKISEILTVYEDEIRKTRKSFIEIQRSLRAATKRKHVAQHERAGGRDEVPDAFAAATEAAVEGPRERILFSDPLGHMIKSIILHMSHSLLTMLTWYTKNASSPYPKTADLDALEKETGLSRKQISHWFTNHRKRMKRMREEQPSDDDDDGDEEGGQEERGDGEEIDDAEENMKKEKKKKKTKRQKNSALSSGNTDDTDLDMIEDLLNALLCRASSPRAKNVLLRSQPNNNAGGRGI